MKIVSFTVHSRWLSISSDNVVKTELEEVSYFCQTTEVFFFLRFW